MTWLVTLWALACAAVPADLVGQPGPPRQAWVLAGVAAAPTVVGAAQTLLVGGTRLGADEPKLGDLCLAAAAGWGVRRLLAQDGLVGLPALAGDAALAVEAAGSLGCWPLGDAPVRRLALARPTLVGPLVMGDTVFCTGGTKVCAATTALVSRWSTDLGAAVTVPLATDGTHLFAAGTGQVVALALGGGQVRWRRPLRAKPTTGLLATAGAVVFGSADGRLRALDAEDGGPLWERPIDGGALAPHLALAGPWVFAATAGGRLTACDATTGEQVWSATRKGPVSSPVVVFGCVLITAGDGELHAVPVDAATKGWRIAAAADGQPLRLGGQPSVHGQRVYVGGAGGVLVAFDLPDARGPAPWPVPGGTAQRAGRVSTVVPAA